MTDSPQNNSSTLSNPPKIKLNLERSAQLREAAKDLALAQLWRTNEAHKLLLDSNQLGMLAEIKKHREGGAMKSVVLASRRIGKTVLLCTMAVREALSKPNARILFLSKTTDQLAEIMDQGMQVVLETCPEDVRPILKIRNNKYVFPNGSEVRCKGLDKVGGNALRGVKADLVIFDEFAFIDNLLSLINDVFMPMAIASHGYILFASSAPSTPGHESVGVIHAAAAEGVLIKRTIYDCPRWTPSQIERFKREAGGEDSTTFKREYLCALVTDAASALLPSATEEKLKELTKIPDPPTYVPDRYVSLDIGFGDMTVALFAYYDYLRGVIVIEDEMVLQGNKATTDNIAAGIKAKEEQLWKKAKPYKRVCDTDPRLIADLKKLSDIHFVATKKDNLHAQVNNANLAILNNQIEINPNCKTLLAHMQFGLWNKSFTQFQRTAALGHCDAVAALVYLIRNISRNKNPIPKQNYSSAYYANTWQEQAEGNMSSSEALKKAFSPTTRR